MPHPKDPNVEWLDNTEVNDIVYRFIDRFVDFTSPIFDSQFWDYDASGRQD